MHAWQAFDLQNTRYAAGFYHHPQQIGDLVDFVVARILDQLRIPHTLMRKWGEK